MKPRHLLIILSLSLFALPSRSLAECKEVKPEIKMDKEGNQVKHGLVVKCYPNGFMKRKGEWKNGKEHGKETEWYKNGEKRYEGIFKDGKEHGKVTLWYENGKKQVEGTWKDGVKAGEWTKWDEDGNKTSF